MLARLGTDPLRLLLRAVDVAGRLVVHRLGLPTRLLDDRGGTRQRDLGLGLELPLVRGPGDGEVVLVRRLAGVQLGL